MRARARAGRGRSRGARRAVDQARVRGGDGGEDSRTLTLVVLTSPAVLDGVQPLEVDEALAVYELLVIEHRVLVPEPDTFLPSEWRRARSAAC